MNIMSRCSFSCLSNSGRSHYIDTYIEAAHNYENSLVWRGFNAPSSITTMAFLLSNDHDHDHDQLEYLMTTYRFLTHPLTVHVV